MKKMAVLMMAALVAGLGVSGARAESASFGFRLGGPSWKESNLQGAGSQSGVQFGPTITYRFGASDQWAVGLDARYGSLDRLERGDFEGAVHYSLSSMFSVFVEARYLWYTFEGKADDPVEQDVKTSGPGVGGGVAAVIPLGDSGFFLSANTRVASMSLDTDVPDASGDSVLWGYEGALAWSVPLDILERGSTFVAAGYRHQEMRGGGLREKVQMPFVEIGFMQRF